MIPEDTSSLSIKIEADKEPLRVVSRRRIDEKREELQYWRSEMGTKSGGKKRSEKEEELK